MLHILARFGGVGIILLEARTGSSFGSCGKDELGKPRVANPAPKIVRNAPDFSEIRIFLPQSEVSGSKSLHQRWVLAQLLTPPTSEERCVLRVHEGNFGVKRHLWGCGDPPSHGM